MAARYAPARALGNLMSGPREKAVEDLVAEGPGTLTRAATTTSEGRGEWTEDGWRVVISRPLPREFGGESPAQIAFAVWEGSRDEVGARKMRTGWISLAKEEMP
jgi:DMSO reductase family type II enzyme heme b subunit